MNKRDFIYGFTIVELMLAVCVFAIGVAFVLRSFLSSAAALDSLRNRTKALQMAQAQMDNLQEAALKGELSIACSGQEQLVLNNRSASRHSDIQELMEEEKDKLLLKAQVSVRWQEAGRDKDVVIASYIKNEK